MQEIRAFGSGESRDQEWFKTVEALEYFAITPTQNVPQIHHLTKRTLGMLKFPIFLKLVLPLWICCSGSVADWNQVENVAPFMLVLSKTLRYWTGGELCSAQRIFKGRRVLEVYSQSGQMMHISFPLIWITQTWFGASKLRMEASWFVRWSV